mmetsp:Transcript_23216/g.72010  ORF Transcript_23216/g.72010 Transcript_23216/m.72010 type:complete len:232 (+) Transcript_23216:825-1520(+)
MSTSSSSRSLPPVTSSVRRRGHQAAPDGSQKAGHLLPQPSFTGTGASTAGAGSAVGVPDAGRAVGSAISARSSSGGGLNSAAATKATKLPADSSNRALVARRTLVGRCRLRLRRVLAASTGSSPGWCPRHQCMRQASMQLRKPTVAVQGMKKPQAANFAAGKATAPSGRLTLLTAHRPATRRHAARSKATQPPKKSSCAARSQGRQKLSRRPMSLPWSSASCLRRAVMTAW